MTIGLKITNNFSAPIATGISDSATTVTLSAGYGSRLTQYAPGQYEYMTLVDQSNNMEIVKAVARSGDYLTIVRAQDGTAARAFIVGDIITSRPCRAALYDAMEVNMAKANVDSQAFTGTPSLPTGTTGVTQTQGNNSTKLATTAYADAVKAASTAYVDSAIASASVLPAQAGHSGQYLTTSGSTASWAAITGGATGFPAPKVGEGIGQWVTLEAGTRTLPAGGTWAYAGFIKQTWFDELTIFYAGVGVGGSNIQGDGIYQPGGFAWRIG